MKTNQKLAFGGVFSIFFGFILAALTFVPFAGAVPLVFVLGGICTLITWGIKHEFENPQ